MEKKIRVIGGQSWFFRISILSELFDSTCWYNPFSKKIKCKVVPIPKAAAMFLRWPWFLPILRLLRMTIFLFYTFPVMGLIWAGSLLFMAFVFPRFLLFAVPFAGLTLTSWQFLSLGILLYLVLNIFFSIPYFLPVSPWHGAEHKTIAAYWQTQSVDREAIKKASAIDKRCGSRFFVPILIQLPVSLLAWVYTGIPFWILYLGSFELIFQLDAYFGLAGHPRFQNKVTPFWAGVFPFSRFSYLTQKYLTVREPSSLHLEVARRAMEGLIEAHETGEGREYLIEPENKEGVIIPKIFSIDIRDVLFIRTKRLADRVVIGLVALGLGIGLVLYGNFPFYIHLVSGIALSLGGLYQCLFALISYIRQRNKPKGGENV